MQLRQLSIPEVKILTPRRFDDSRGWFSETWNRSTLLSVGIDLDFCQENQSLSREKGTIRGVHFQTPPRAQDKLVRVVKGRIWDVAVDLRRDSPTYRKWVAEELSAESGTQILVPRGFGHGFCTLEPDTEVAYLVSDFYAPAHDAAVAWNDPDLAIAWPTTQPEMSDKDRGAPRLAEISPPF
jgi:dTDP-4-dehydrorhamnose 3,5-epimerase